MLMRHKWTDKESSHVNVSCEHFEDIVARLLGAARQASNTRIQCERFSITITRLQGAARQASNVESGRCQTQHSRVLSAGCGRAGCGVDRGKQNCDSRAGFGSVACWGARNFPHTEPQGPPELHPAPDDEWRASQ
jgi:hypothetical protein